MSKIERDEISGTDTTGHEWDGIKELNTPLPRWWVLTFYVTVAWAIVYTILYPAWPLPGGATPGILGYSSRGALQQQLDEAQASQAQLRQQIATADMQQILANDNLKQFATAAGAAAFKVNCVQCHGSGAAGSVGYPNLNDNDWLWGGTIEQIHQTLVNGIRYPGNADTRDSQMPAFGTDGILTAEQITDVSNYVLTLSGVEADKAAAERGAPIFAENCASCHGEKGLGNKELGSPNLADQIWLYGDPSGKDLLQTVVSQVQKPRQGVMPAWGARLDEATVKELAVYVYSLGGGEQSEVTQ